MQNVISKFYCAALARNARKIIDEHKPFVIVVTGSGDRASIVNAIYSVFHDNFGDEVMKSPDGLNAIVGIPLSVLGYRRPLNFLTWIILPICSYFRAFRKKYFKYLVLELDVKAKADFDYLVKILKPDVAAIIFPSERFNGIVEVAKPDAKIFINVDEAYKFEHKKDQFVSVGINNSEANYSVSNIKKTKDGVEYRIETLGQKISIKTPLVGDSFIYSQLFAFAIGQYLNIQSLKIKASLEKINS